MYNIGDLICGLRARFFFSLDSACECFFSHPAQCAAATQLHYFLGFILNSPRLALYCPVRVSTWRLVTPLVLLPV